MSRRRQVMVVAGWEFRRYFKWKDQLIGLAVLLALGALWLVTARVLSTQSGTFDVALEGLEMATPPEGRLRFAAATGNAEERLAALAAGDLHGLLSRRPDGSFELLVAKDPRYRAELEALLGEVVRRERLEGSGLGEADLAKILAPPELDVRFTRPERAALGRGEKVAAGVFIAIMLMTVFTAMAYLLTGITGEKQLRVTESVVAAISPQSWIDGKLLGITAYALVSVGILIGGGLLVALGAQGALGWELPEAAVRPGTLVVLLVFTALGLLLWNTFFAAVAATIDDPNTSSRSSLVLLPALPVVLALAVIRDPDGIVARVLALLPATSAPAMPVRAVLSDPGFLEIAVAATLLLAAIAVLRWYAGRIFEVGMLLYGKEPTLSEILRLLKHRL